MMHLFRSITASTTGEEVKKLKIDLTYREIPPDEEQQGVFVDVVKVPKKDKKEKVHTYLVLIAELEAKKSSGKRFVASCGFHLEDERGLKSLRKQLKVWRGSDAMPSLNDFDPEVEFLGKPFVAKPTIAGKGAKREIVFSAFKPYTGDNPLTPSGDYVRASVGENQQ